MIVGKKNTKDRPREEGKEQKIVAMIEE